MSIVFRYLTRQVIISMLAVSGILLLVFMSGRFIKYLADAAAGELAGDVLFQIMAYRFPGFLELILPLGFFIGILLAYGRMYLESEMTVLFACGVSDKQLLMKTLLGSIPVLRHHNNACRSKRHFCLTYKKPMPPLIPKAHV